MLIVWMMNLIHSGVVDVFPLHTLLILTVTVRPIIDKLLTYLPDIDEAMAAEHRLTKS